MFRKILFSSLSVLFLLAIIQCTDETKIIPPPVNYAPSLAAIADTGVVEGDTLNLTIIATDADSAIPTLSCLNLPENASFTDNQDGSGLFEFVPSESQVQVFTIKFTASDGELADTIEVQITVLEQLNYAPEIEEIADQEVIENDTLNLTISATDINGDLITLTVLNLPENASFTDNQDGSGLFEFIPIETQVQIFSIKFVASDGELTDTMEVSIAVVDRIVLYENNPPVIDEINPQNVRVGDTLNFTISATDLDNTQITLHAEYLPNNSTFVDNGDGTGLFEFRPDETQVMQYQVMFIASDGVLADTIEIQIIVLEIVNYAPVIEVITDQQVLENETLTFTVSAIDPNENLLLLTIQNLPENAIFTDNQDGSASFEFNPSYEQAGVYHVIFVAYDGELSDTLLVNITVKNTNRIPIITSPTKFDFEIIVNAILEFPITAFDADGDDLTITVENIPDNSALTDNGDGSWNLEFQPDEFQVGIHWINLTVSDYMSVVSDSIKISVVENTGQFSHPYFPVNPGNSWEYDFTFNDYNSGLDTSWTETCTIFYIDRSDNSGHWELDHKIAGLDSVFASSGEKIAMKGHDYSMWRNYIYEPLDSLGSCFPFHSLSVVCLISNDSTITVPAGDIEHCKVFSGFFRGSDYSWCSVFIAYGLDIGIVSYEIESWRMNMYYTNTKGSLRSYNVQ